MSTLTPRRLLITVLPYTAAVSLMLSLHACAVVAVADATTTVVAVADVIIPASDVD